MMDRGNGQGGREEDCLNNLEVNQCPFLDGDACGLPNGISIAFSRTRDFGPPPRHTVQLTVIRR